MSGQSIVEFLVFPRNGGYKLFPGSFLIILKTTMVRGVFPKNDFSVIKHVSLIECFLNLPTELQPS